jgi:hypothetical protein
MNPGTSTTLTSFCSRANEGEKIVYYLVGGGYIGGHPLRTHLAWTTAQQLNVRVFGTSAPAFSVQSLIRLDGWEKTEIARQEKIPCESVEEACRECRLSACRTSSLWAIPLEEIWRSAWRDTWPSLRIGRSEKNVLQEVLDLGGIR